MVNLEKERLKARKAIEALYEGTCRIYSYSSDYDKEAHSMVTKEVVFAEDTPCRLSYSSKQTANQTSTVDIADQEILLFLAPEVRCRAGSRVEVTQNDVTRLYECMGLSALYYTHQEAKLKLVEVEA